MTHQISNLLLNALPSQVRTNLSAGLQAVPLPLGTVLCNPGERPEYAHFITSGVASVVTFMSDGNGAEVGLIGREGLPEGLHLLGPANSPTSAFMQIEGTGLRMRFVELQKMLFASEPLLHCILAHAQCQAFVGSQIAACNGLHEIEERLARWLLMVRDRLESDRFYLTQEFLAEMLGARRTSVTMAAGSLQRSGLIEYRRGHIKIVDNDGLQNAACECYQVVHNLVVNLYR